MEITHKIVSRSLVVMIWMAAKLDAVDHIVIIEIEKILVNKNTHRTLPKSFKIPSKKLRDFISSKQ